ncbi:thermonuclease family protein [Ammoniphilus sp. CFH 90114]|uniref:thermonuclease family protein n=1 Tax=Ammoniphilus sp. CFH 90114 TaxID=2493665 RepID=UPI0013E8FD71|nr:thermonuclease family protein [Ammoniphilus sp. CFH 90114]
MVRKVKIPYFIGFLILIVSGLLSGCVSQSQDGPAMPKDAKKLVVKRVVDGDTFVLEDNRKVRLIGINTPESVDPRRPVEFYGKEASAYTKKLLEGKQVLIQWGRTPKDRYDRWLAWVWLPDGTFVNGHFVAEGYAQVYTFKDNPDHAEYLLELQKKAREEVRGLWGKEPVEPLETEETAEPTQPSTTSAVPASQGSFLASKNSEVYHEVGCPGAVNIAEDNKLYFKSEEEAKESGRRMCKVSGCTKG